jgi:transcriptional regulator with XRE-family HTH domain
MSITPLKDIPEWTLAFCRERYRTELSEAISDLMEREKIRRVQLAELLGKDKSWITRVLSGTENLGADTLVDILLVLGRAPHLTMDDDFEGVRFATDEVLEREEREKTARTQTVTVDASDETPPTYVLKDYVDGLTITGHRAAQRTTTVEAGGAYAQARSAHTL